MEERLLLTIEEACKQLGGIGRSHMYKILGRGELVSIKIGRCRRIPASELIAYVTLKLKEQGD
jgi:excisionase family DNA binding protein